MATEKPLTSAHRDYLRAFDAWLEDGGLDGLASEATIARKRTALEGLTGSTESNGFHGSTGRVSSLSSKDRRCRYCECRLSRYNPDGYCAPCAPKGIADEEREQEAKAAREATRTDAFAFLREIRATD